MLSHCPICRGHVEKIEDVFIQTKHQWQSDLERGKVKGLNLVAVGCDICGIVMLTS